MSPRRRLATLLAVVVVLLAGAAGGYALGAVHRHRAPALSPIQVPAQHVDAGQLRSPVTVPALRTGGG